MWRSVLLHEFADRNPGSIQGLPGRLSPGSLALSPSEGIILIAPGRTLQYVLEPPLIDVIGVSCSVRFRHPARAVSSSVRIIRLGEEFMLSLEPLTTFQALVRVRVHRVWHDIGQLPNPSSGFVELGFDWHTSGKTYLRVDRRLVGYHDALSRGSRLTIEDVAFGSPETPAGSPDPHYQLGEFSVRALSRHARWPRRHVTGVHHRS
ncbi:hypothetical protein [Kribbella pratensis]|uniref:Uncharacterized protein n=1 Tax=Kribbella pratensis TaxID=2512112 RepID=A0A4R8CMG1_9ACTN|nr:hypothetical protein [Kribbella pratensis]TDW77243.1 hypothetical protein EV653_2408 [Kribbella pratensis]